MNNRILDYVVENSIINVLYEARQLQIHVITDDIIRVFVNMGKTVVRSKAIERDKTLPTKFVTDLKDGILAITTRNVVVRVSDDCKVDFYDEDNPVCLEYEGDRKSRKDEDFKVFAAKRLGKDDCIYGLGDKTGFLNKRDYEYVMWNTDNPEPHMDNFKSLYKSIPFFIVLGVGHTYGIFLDNTYKSYFNMGKESNETYSDMCNDCNETRSNVCNDNNETCSNICNDGNETRSDGYYYFASEGGNLDYYYISGRRMTDVVTNYTYLTGRTPLPQLWTLGHHQSRWSYTSRDEVMELARTYREHRIPCDVIHLDIDYMDKYKVFTIDGERFHDFKEMTDALARDGFKVVTIIDPGVKLEEGYSVYEEGVKNKYFATTPDGKVYVNEVWPGEAVYPDFGNPKVREWWAGKQEFLIRHGVRGVWNDMNEPASFKGELPQDVVFTDEDAVSDHARMHNVYGHLMSRAAYEGWIMHDGRRPFLITRACYAGTQKYSTGWTGDNHSIWAHLQMLVPQLLNLSLSGMSFVGTDVGGFGSDCTPELMARWVQAGCFSPLFRNHSAIGTRRQEPWTFGERVLDIYRTYCALRYKLIPYYYDLFRICEQTGLPVLRPLVLHYEGDANVRSLNDEFLVGENVLVSPVVTQGATMKMVYLPEGTWYDYHTGERMEGGAYHMKEAPMDVCPIYVRAGGIIPNFPPMEYVGQSDVDELVLDIYEGEGIYTHYQDNGEDFAYRDGEYNEYRFGIDKDHRFTAEVVHHGYDKVYKGLCIRYRGGTVRETFVDGKVDVQL